MLLQQKQKLLQQKQKFIKKEDKKGCEKQKEKDSKQNETRKHWSKCWKMPSFVGSGNRIVFTSNIRKFKPSHKIHLISKQASHYTTRQPTTKTTTRTTTRTTIKISRHKHKIQAVEAKQQKHIPLQYRCIHPFLTTKSKRVNVWRAKNGVIELPIKHRSCSLLVANLRRKRLGIHESYWNSGRKAFYQRRLRAGLSIISSPSWYFM